MFQVYPVFYFHIPSYPIYVQFPIWFPMLFQYRVFLKWWYPQIIHFFIGCSIINQPFLGTPISGNLRISPVIVAVSSPHGCGQAETESWSWSMAAFVSWNGSCSSGWWDNFVGETAKIHGDVKNLNWDMLAFIEIPSGKHQKTMGNHHVQWVNQL